MLNPALIERIRAIFLHHESRVTIAEVAGVLGWSRAQMNVAIRNGEIEVGETCSGKRIELRELAACALQQWRLTAIEEALGRDATLILPPALRTRRLTVRLPRYQMGARGAGGGWAGVSRRDADANARRAGGHESGVALARHSGSRRGDGVAGGGTERAGLLKQVTWRRCAMSSRLSEAIHRLPALSRSRRRRERKPFERPVTARTQPQPRPARAPYVLTLSSRRIVRRTLPEAVVPYLRVSGRWLEEHGFAIGGVQVVVEHGRVTLISAADAPRRLLPSLKARFLSQFAAPVPPPPPRPMPSASRRFRVNRRASLRAASLGDRASEILHQGDTGVLAGDRDRLAIDQRSRSGRAACMGAPPRSCRRCR